MTTTLQEVADAAGVSRSTASRALAGSPLISAGTRESVQAAAQTLGYRVNRLASGLRSRQSRLIGLVLNNLINASFHTIADVVQRRAHDAGYQVILLISDADPLRERELLNTLADHHADGLILIGTGQNCETTNRMLSSGTAVVDLIRSPSASTAPAVLAEDRDGADQAIRHLLELGHRRIGYIGGPPDTNSGSERFAGYAAALAQQGVPLDPVLVHRGPFTPQFGAAAATALLDASTGMTALFAANHEAVFGVLPTLQARSIALPRDLSLVCYEDIEWLQWWQPAITVIDNGARELGELAMDLLLDQMGSGGRPGPAQHGRTHRIRAQLVRRDSTRALPH